MKAVKSFSKNVEMEFIIEKYRMSFMHKEKTIVNRKI